MQGSNEPRPRRMTEIRINRDHILLAMIVLTGTLLRLLRFVSVREGGLNPDAMHFRELAILIQHGSYSYGSIIDTGAAYREPAFPLLLTVVFMIFGSSFDTMRLTTVLLSILLIPLTYKIGKETFCSSCGLLASFLVATNYHLIYSSTDGMREELFAALMIIFLYFSFTAGENDENYLKAAFFSFLLCLVKYEGVLIVLAVVLWLSWRARSQGRRIPRKKISAILFFLILFFLFIFTYGIVMSGDPFAASTLHGSYYYWYEFLAADMTIYWPELGISMFEYLFVYHTPLELLQGVIWGLFVLFEIDLFGISFFWSVLMMFGILLASVEDRGVYLAIGLILVVPFLSFFGNIGASIRLFYSFIPIFSVLISNAAFRLYQTGVLHYNNLDGLHRFFVTVIFCSVLIRYVMVNLICITTFSFCGSYPLLTIRYAPGIYPFVLVGFVIFVILFLFYYQERLKKTPP